MMAKVVRVDWLDAHGGVRDGWKDMAEVAKVSAAPAVSFGVLVKRTKRSIVVCPHFVNSDDEKGINCTLENSKGDGEICIPMKWVTKLTELGDL